jgi:membrane protein DedA with SNARE-associated domain
VRSRVAVATAVSRGLCVVAGVVVLTVLGTGVASAAGGAAVVVDDSMDVGVAGTVGVVAVLVGAVGLVYGLTRRHRQALARRAARRAGRP